MVDEYPAALNVLFRAIADPTRRAMIARLAREARTVGELAEPFDISLAAASKHIQVLERAGLVRRTVQGRTHTVRLHAEPLRAGIEWMRRYEKFWNERLDALEEQLRADDARATAERQRDEGSLRRGPRIVPPHERSSRRNSGRKGS
jgi:DNA-binding transcriptional ArsR family regulator